MTRKRALEVNRLVAAAHRGSEESSAARALAKLASEQWHLAATLGDSPGRQHLALLHAEEYARAALVAMGGSEEGTPAVPQD